MFSQGDQLLLAGRAGEQNCFLQFCEKSREILLRKASPETGGVTHPAFSRVRTNFIQGE